ncbi:hypothetical protein VKT23_017054 [Stygiomarasmius scandens]|uniref:Uncharacterized protein n=1 Tax=Marasmiellus scandens TaxID=2682957 RepID=A0ABR1IT05_9AGAR
MPTISDSLNLHLQLSHLQERCEYLELERNQLYRQVGQEQASNAALRIENSVLRAALTLELKIGSPKTNGWTGDLLDGSNSSDSDLSMTPFTDANHDGPPAGDFKTDGISRQIGSTLLSSHPLLQTSRLETTGIMDNKIDLPMNPLATPMTISHASPISSLSELSDDAFHEDSRPRSPGLTQPLRTRKSRRLQMNVSEDNTKVIPRKRVRSEDFGESRTNSERKKVKMTTVSDFMTRERERRPSPGDIIKLRVDPSLLPPDLLNSEKLDDADRFVLTFDIFDDDALEKLGRERLRQLAYFYEVTQMGTNVDVCERLRVARLKDGPPPGLERILRRITMITSAFDGPITWL